MWPMWPEHFLTDCLHVWQKRDRQTGPILASYNDPWTTSSGDGGKYELSISQTEIYLII
jgi:hypothetical protein